TLLRRLGEPEAEPLIKLQGCRAHSHALLLRHKVEDVPALLAAEAIPGVLLGVHLELPGGLPLAEGTGTYEVLALRGELGREVVVIEERHDRNRALHLRKRDEAL